MCASLSRHARHTFIRMKTKGALPRVIASALPPSLSRRTSLPTCSAVAKHDTIRGREARSWMWSESLQLYGTCVTQFDMRRMASKTIRKSTKYSNTSNGSEVKQLEGLSKLHPPVQDHHPNTRGTTRTFAATTLWTMSELAARTRCVDNGCFIARFAVLN